jgi:hypothetical protein
MQTIVSLAKNYKWQSLVRFDAATRKKVKSGEYATGFADKQSILHDFFVEYGNHTKTPGPPYSPKGGGGGDGKKGVCRFFNTPDGCKKGDACDFKHVKKTPKKE